jgi:hypothetical protein
MSTALRMKRGEIIADNLSKAGWSWGCVSAIDSGGANVLTTACAAFGACVRLGFIRKATATFDVF